MLIRESEEITHLGTNDLETKIIYYTLVARHGGFIHKTCIMKEIESQF